MSLIGDGIGDDDMGIDLALKPDQWKRLEKNKTEVLEKADALKRGLDKDIGNVTTALYVVGGSLATIAVIYAVGKVGHR